MKMMQIVAHTAGGEVRSATEAVTERDYEQLKASLLDLTEKNYLEFNTEDGWVVIPLSQIFYVEIVLT